MPTVSGSLLFVSSRAAQVSEVWVRAPKVRTHAEGLVTTGNDHFPVIDGQVEFTAVPGPAVLALISQGRAVDTVPIVVGESDSQTLRQVVNAAAIADDATKREIEKLAAQAVELVDSSTENARTAQDGATRAESAAGEAKHHEANAASSASAAENSATAASSNASKASTSEQNAAESASAAATSASRAENNATSAKQEADRAASIADSTSWDGDKLIVNGKTSPSLTGPKGDPGLKGDPGPKGDPGASTWNDVTGKPVAVNGSGNPPEAVGSYSTALGMYAQSGGDYSTVVGMYAQSGGDSSTALGMGARAAGESSTALGRASRAEGAKSTAIGYGVVASEDNTIVIGKGGQTVIIAGRNLLTEIDVLKERIEALENK